MQTIKIRFNTNFPAKSQYEWRVIVDGVEHLVNGINIQTPAYTSSEFIEGHGLKHHITTEAEFFSIVEAGVLNKVAYIK